MNRALYHDAWLRFRLFDEVSWHPERLGKRRRIFAAAHRHPMALQYLEPATQTSHKEWKLEGGDRTLSLFKHLGKLASQHEASILYATYDDGTFVVPHWERQFTADTWGPSILSEFELTPSEQGGAQFLVLLFRANQAAVIFTRHAEFLIDYYGGSDLWHELSDTLYRKVARPTNGV